MSTQTTTVVDEIRRLAAIEDELALAAIENRGNDGEPLPPDASYWQAVTEWLEAYDPAVLPQAAHSMRRLKEVFDRYMATDEPEVPFDFWAARHEAQQRCHLDPPRPRVRPTPTELHADKVPLRQIAYEWRWLLPSGEPDVERVQRELGKPGSELTPDAIEERRQFDLDQLGFIYHPEDEVPSEEEPPAAETLEPGPPSLEDLVKDGATVAQICNLKSKQYPSTVADEWAPVVRAFARVVGAALPENAQSIANEGGRESIESAYGKDYVDAPLAEKPVMPESEIPCPDKRRRGKRNKE